MAAENVCQYYKFGHCKFQTNCPKKHIHELCQEKNCEIRKCSLRHPKLCRFYLQYGRCKFDPCSFKHELPPRYLKAIEDVTEKILKEKDNEVETLQSLLKANALKLTDIEEKFAKLEEKVEKLNVTANENDFELLRNKIQLIENEKIL